MTHDSEYWDWRVENAVSPEDFKEAMDGLLSSMVDHGLISMSWDDEQEEFVFFMTPRQKEIYDSGEWV
mgnify:CR=1 FL=1